MTPELIKQWADQADKMADDQLQCPGEFHPDWHEVRDGFFAALVAAHQRELDAKVAEDRAIAEDDCPSAVNGWWPDQVLFRCAAAIRGTK